MFPTLLCVDRHVGLGGIQVKFKKRIFGLMLAIVTSAGISIFLPTPAHASLVGTWRAYEDTNPITSSPYDWSCNGTIALSRDRTLLAQICMIKKSGNIRQGAVIIRNSRSSLYRVAVNMTITDYLWGDEVGYWECSSSGVASHSWSVCFSSNVSSLTAVYVSKSHINNLYGQNSPPA